MIADDGLFGAMRIAFNVIRIPAARQRILEMRKIFRRYEERLWDLVTIARKPLTRSSQ